MPATRAASGHFLMIQRPTLPWEQQQTWKYEMRPTESKQLVRMVVHPSICRHSCSSKSTLTMHVDYSSRSWQVLVQGFPSVMGGLRSSNLQSEACPCMSSLLRLVRLAPALLPNQPDHATMVISHIIIILRVSGECKRIFYRHIWPDQRPPCVRGGHPALRQFIACLHICADLSIAVTSSRHSRLGCDQVTDCTCLRPRQHQQAAGLLQ